MKTKNISFEPREINVSYSKSGSGSITTRINIPITWLRKLGVDEESREVILEFDEDRIIIRKNNENLL